MKKIVHYLADDNSVELYTLTRGEIAETYLRRGGSVEIVEGEVDLDWQPPPHENRIDLRKPDNSSWSQHGGFKTKTLPNGNGKTINF